MVTYPFNNDSTVALFGVFDGHGSNGEVVSDYVMWKVQELLLAQPAPTLAAQPAECLVHAFEQADRALTTANVSARVSGTAAVVTMLTGSTLVRACPLRHAPRECATRHALCGRRE